MSRWTAVFVRTGILCLLGGCVHGGNTRLPRLDYRDPVVEKHSYRLHDPFPDAAAGPETMQRPREFVKQRSEPRRAAEQRTLQGLPAEAIPPGAEPLPPGAEYPQSLRY
ncbi:MAG: hypothetical protein WD069_21895 [Planctomycetales bacterium]